ALPKAEMRLGLVVVSLLFVACDRRPASLPAVEAGVEGRARTANSTQLPSPTPRAADGGSVVKTATDGLPEPDFGTPAPVRAVGYPVRVRTGANDPASHVGFTRGAKEFGYCWTDGGLGATWCEFVDGAGKTRIWDTRAETERGESNGK